MNRAAHLGFVVVCAALVGGSELVVCVMILAGVTYILLDGGPYYRLRPRSTPPRGTAARPDAP